MEGGGEDDFDFTRFLTGGGREGGSLMPPCTFPADSGLSIGFQLPGDDIMEIKTRGKLHLEFI